MTDFLSSEEVSLVFVRSKGRLRVRSELAPGLVKRSARCTETGSGETDPFPERAKLSEGCWQQRASRWHCREVLTPHDQVSLQVAQHSKRHERRVIPYSFNVKGGRQETRNAAE